MPKSLHKRFSPLAIIWLVSAFYSATVQASPAANFELPTTQGTVTLSKLKGKVVYVDFWASWCAPCRKSFPWMNDTQKRYKKLGFTVVAINLDKDMALAKRFLKDQPANFIVAFDPSGNTAQQYHVKGMPSSYLITRDGQIASSHIGFREKDKAGLEEKIRQLLKQSPLEMSKR